MQLLTPDSPLLSTSNARSSRLIRPRHSRAFRAIFGWYTEWLLYRRFHTLWVKGAPPDDERPHLLSVQHVTWWDPLVLLHCARRLPFSGVHYAMMDRENLEQHRFFRLLGAFGIDRSNAVTALPALRYALDRLKEDHARVVMFPQGGLQPMDERPLRCASGAATLARRSRVHVVPVALRYEHREMWRPEIFVSIGKPHKVDATKDLLDLMHTQADVLRREVYADQLDGYRRFLRQSVRRIPAGGHSEGPRTPGKARSR